MARVTRRTLVQMGLGAAAWAAVRPAGLRAAQPKPAADPADFGLEALGRIEPRPSKEIDASPLSVGFETLDRRLFDPKRTYPHVAQLGVKWARCQTGWARTETRKGQYDFAWLDEVVDSLRGLGVQPWFNLGYGNPLYTVQADEAAVGWAPVFDEATSAAWVRYVQAIAEHFAGRVAHWEIWNEPNIATFWKPRKPNPADYVRLVQATAPEIRKRIPKAVIIGGALAGIPLGYLKGCLDAGLAEHVDAISYHPYRARPEQDYETQVRQLRALVAKHKPGVGIWQGECGCPSVGGGSGALAKYPWNEQRQAKWLLRRIVTDLGLEVDLTSYFLIVDLVGYRGKTNPKGLLRGSDYTPKPAYRAYQHVCALFDSDTRVMSYQESQGMHLVVFRRRGRLVSAYWAPTDLMEDWGQVDIPFTYPTRRGAPEPRPVLVDLLSGRIYKTKVERQPDGSWRLPSVPLMDYPLLLTEGQVVGV